MIFDFTTRQSIYLVGLLLTVLLTTFEVHEQLHRLAAKVLDLEPVYRRLKGYVVIQETWISRRELNLMTAAPIFVIQVPTLVIFIFSSGTIGDIAEITFILNAGFIAKDISDIIFNLRLPRETQFWMSDLGGEAVAYFSSPDHDLG
ncbi:metalloprotease family protein [Halorubrum luteum]